MDRKWIFLVFFLEMKSVILLVKRWVDKVGKGILDGGDSGCKGMEAGYF